MGAGGAGHQVPALPPPRTAEAEAPLEDTVGRHYQLPIAREDVRVLASWEELARHEAELLQVGRQGLPVEAPSSRPTAGHTHRPVYGRPCCEREGPPHTRGSQGGQASQQPPDPHPAAPAQAARLSLQPGQVVGLDLEWRPSFGAWDRPPASLMQVAVEGRVFLLDLLTLTQPVDGPASRALSGLVSRLLSDPSITKLGKRSLPPALAVPTPGRGGGAGRVGPWLGAHHPLGLPTGYGMAGDLKRLAASCPALALAPEQLQGGLDLLPVHGQVSARGGQAHRLGPSSQALPPQPCP